MIKTTVLDKVIIKMGGRMLDGSNYMRDQSNFYKCKSRKKYTGLHLHIWLVAEPDLNFDSNTHTGCNESYTGYSNSLYLAPGRIVHLKFLIIVNNTQCSPRPYNHQVFQIFYMLYISFY